LAIARFVAAIIALVSVKVAKSRFASGATPIKLGLSPAMIEETMVP
jgi:hypothetical protein